MTTHVGSRVFLGGQPGPSQGAGLRFPQHLRPPYMRTQYEKQQLNSVDDQTRCEANFNTVDHECWRSICLRQLTLFTLIIGLVNWMELYRYWRRRQQRSSWLESSPISRTVQSRFQYSERIHGTVHRGTWTDSGSSLTIFAADSLQPCLYNISLHSFICSLTFFRRRRCVIENQKVLLRMMRLKLPLQIHCRITLRNRVKKGRSKQIPVVGDVSVY